MGAQHSLHFLVLPNDADRPELHDHGLRRPGAVSPPHACIDTGPAGPAYDRPGHPVDIPALEDGHTASQGPGFLAALAGALEWRVGLLRVAWELPAIDQDASFADKIVFLYARDEATMIREELDDLHDLHQVLMQWADDLTNRACVLRSRTRLPWLTHPSMRRTRPLVG
jgi:hypothetical protein